MSHEKYGNGKVSKADMFFFASPSVSLYYISINTSSCYAFEMNYTGFSYHSPNLGFKEVCIWSLLQNVGDYITELVETKP